jgi:hypothetical protein
MKVNFMNKSELLKAMPNLSDEQAEYIVRIILSYKRELIRHIQKILEREQEIYELKVKLGIIKEEPKEDGI